MIVRRALLAAVALTAWAVPGRLFSQNRAELLQQGIRAYRELEFDAARDFLRQALEESGEGLSESDLADAYSYLAASQVFAGALDSAAATFRELVLFDVRYQPDRLVFPPNVTNVYDRVRRETKVVTAAAPARAQFRPGSGRFSTRLYASSFHRVRATIRGSGNRIVRTVYRGPIVDSLDVDWDGLDDAGRYLRSGSYWLAVTSIDTSGTDARALRIPLEITAIVGDTIPHPDPPADSLFLPETNPSGPAVESLVGGLLIGGAMMALPGALTGETDLGSAPYVVGATVSLAGIVGFLSKRPGKVIPANVEANAALRSEWQDGAERAARRNEQIRADVQLVVESGPVSVMSQETRGG